MSQKIAHLVVRTIGIDTGKNTRHLIGLDHEGTIVLRAKVGGGRIGSRLRECATVPDRYIEAGMATHYVARELAAPGQLTRSRKRCSDHQHAAFQ